MYNFTVYVEHCTVWVILWETLFFLWVGLHKCENLVLLRAFLGILMGKPIRNDRWGLKASVKIPFLWVLDKKRTRIGPKIRLITGFPIKNTHKNYSYHVFMGRLNCSVKLLHQAIQ